MTRDEYITLAKLRALEYVEAHDYQQAIISMMSDMGKHEETKNHPGIVIGTMILLKGGLNYVEVKNFIEGFR